jgi:hypothetical protein
VPGLGGGQLTGVAATSASNAWAVGHTGTSREKTLILHWKPMPGPGSPEAVAITSARNAWTAGGRPSLELTAPFG